MHVCTYVCTYVHAAYLCMHTYLHTHVLYVHTCLCTYVRSCICVCRYVHAFVYSTRAMHTIHRLCVCFIYTMYICNILCCNCTHYSIRNCYTVYTLVHMTVHIIVYQICLLLSYPCIMAPMCTIHIEYVSLMVVMDVSLAWGRSSLCQPVTVSLLPWCCH